MSDESLLIGAGLLRHQITIQSQDATKQDDFGQPIILWNGVRTCYGGIDLVAMKETFGYGQLSGQATNIWTVRWTPYPVIVPEMRISFVSKTYIIQAVSNVMERNAILHLLCLQLSPTS